MSNKQRCLMIGVGGMARHWTDDVFATHKDRMEIAALIDINPTLLSDAGTRLGVPNSALFTSIEEAFAKVDADFCCIVTPPKFHRQAVELACERGIDILSEKPISDTWESCVAISNAVQKAGVKMMITQNYRYTPRILTLKKAVAELGNVNYIMSRYACDYRVRGAWGAAFRHEMAHSLLIEGGVHHFDQIRNLSGADVRTITGYEWNPGQTRGDNAKWKGSDSFDGESCAIFTLQMTDGSFGCYEGNNLASGKTNGWHEEYYRVECEGGTAVLDRDHTVRIEERRGNQLQVREVATEHPKFSGHVSICDQFLTWLEGGEAPATTLQDNIKSNATLYGAIQAAETGQVVNVEALVREATGE